MGHFLFLSFFIGCSCLFQTNFSCSVRSHRFLSLIFCAFSFFLHLFLLHLYSNTSCVLWKEKKACSICRAHIPLRSLSSPLDSYGLGLPFIFPRLSRYLYISHHRHAEAMAPLSQPLWKRWTLRLLEKKKMTSTVYCSQTWLDCSVIPPACYRKTICSFIELRITHCALHFLHTCVRSDLFGPVHPSTSLQSLFPDIIMCLFIHPHLYLR